MAVRAFAIGVVLLCSACISSTYGSLPEVGRLSQLRARESTRREVRSVLGDPRGSGTARFGPELGVQEIWFYDYFNLGMGVDTAMLLVIFEQDRYIGHVWFSSLEGKDLGVKDEVR